jgi:hypothetical protein
VCLELESSSIVMIRLIRIHWISSISIQFAFARLDHVDEEGESLFFHDRDGFEMTHNALKQNREMTKRSSKA